MEVRQGKSTRIIIKCSISDFFDINRIQTILGNSNYIERKAVNEYRSRKSKIPIYDTVYTFREIPEIYELTVGPNYVQITLTELVNESVFLDIIKKIFSEEFQKYFIFIRQITCVNFESCTARTYDEIQETNITGLLPNLAETEDSLKHISEGDFGDAEYTVELELSRCQASFFNMDDALSFRKIVTIESKDTGEHGRLNSIDDILDAVRNSISYGQKLIK